MPSYTTNYSIPLPVVNSPVDEDLWGDELNSGLNIVDPLLKVGITNTLVNQTTSFTASASISLRNTYICDATGGAIVATLPLASSCPNGCTVSFKKSDSSANAVTPTVSGSDTTDATALTLQGQAVVLISDGLSKWQKLCDSTIISDASTSTKGIIQIASNAEAIAGTDTLKAVTPAAFASAKSLASSGYYKLPGGLIIQWGISGTASGTETITLPISFATMYSFTATIYNGGNSGEVAKVDSYTSSTVTIKKIITNTLASSNSPAFWTAIGV